MKTLIVSVAKAGHVNQCLAVCERAGWEPFDTVEIPAPGRLTNRWDRFKIGLRRRMLTPRITPRARGAGPLRIVASGSVAEKLVAAYRGLYGDDLFAVFVGRPKRPGVVFDAAIVSVHALEPGEAPDAFRSASSRETFVMRGVPTRKLRAGDAPDERHGLGVLIGGVNKAFHVDADPIVAQLEQTLSERASAPVSIAFSRRTPGSVEERVRAAFDRSNIRFVGRDDRAGFVKMMVSASDFLVTPDSLTMVSEACATGRPVQIFDLACFDADSSTNRCMVDLLAGGEITRHGQPTAARPSSAFEVPAPFFAAYDRWERRRVGLGA